MLAKIKALFRDKPRLILYADRIILGSLCLLIFCLPFAKAGAESFTLLAFVFWMLKRVWGYRAKQCWGMLADTKLNKAIGIYLCVNVLAVIFSSNLGLSLRGFFGKELKFVAIYFMLVEVVNSRERLKCVLTAIFASAILLTTDAAVQYFRGIDFLRKYGMDRLRASFGTASGFAAWLVVIAQLFLGLLLTGKIINKKIKALLIVLLTCLLVCLLATYARGAWLGFICGIALIAAYLFKSFSLKVKRLCVFTGIGVLILFLVLPSSLKVKVISIGRVNLKSGQTVNARVKSTLKFDEGSNLIRIKLWNESLKIIRDYNFTGSGLNTYSIIAKNYKSFELGGIYPHNSYLQKAAEIGLFGLTAFLGVILMFFKIALGYFKHNKDYLVLGLLAGILGFLVHAFFDTHLYSLQLVVLFWYIIGLTMATVKFKIDLIKT